MTDRHALPRAAGSIRLIGEKKNHRLSRWVAFLLYLYHYHLKEWQRRRDLNPRAGCPTYRISSADPSASWVLLRALRRSLKKSFIIWLHSSPSTPDASSGS